jgi:hypothetical protein
MKAVGNVVPVKAVSRFRAICFEAGQAPDGEAPKINATNKEKTICLWVS